MTLQSSSWAIFPLSQRRSAARARAVSSQSFRGNLRGQLRSLHAPFTPHRPPFVLQNNSPCLGDHRHRVGGTPYVHQFVHRVHRPFPRSRGLSHVFGAVVQPVQASVEWGKGADCPPGFPYHSCQTSASGALSRARERCAFPLSTRRERTRPLGYQQNGMP